MTRKTRFVALACGCFILVGALLGNAPVWAAGGGGSAAIFSLDPFSPSGTAGDLYIDGPESTVPGVITPPIMALPAIALGIAPVGNVDALGGGRDVGVYVAMNPIGPEPNTLDQVAIVYQFSSDREARDGVTGDQLIPGIPGPFFTYIDQTTGYSTDYDEGHAMPDIGGNRGGLLGVAGRVNTRDMDHLILGLLGPDETPNGETDNVDAFTSVGAIGGGPDVDPENGLLDDGVWIYYSVQSGPGIAGLPGPALDRPSIIYYVEGTGGGTTPMIYFDPIAAGLLAVGDDVDAVDVWDDGIIDERNGIFEPGDGFVFSLRAGSPSLPITVGGVDIDEGGIFLVEWIEPAPGVFTPAITTALPGRYFSLAEADAGALARGEPIPADDLDEIHMTDPRDPTAPYCPGMAMRAVAANEALIPSPPYAEMFMPVSGPVCVSPALEIFVAMNDRRRPGMPIVSSYGGTVTIEGTVGPPSVGLLGATPLLYGPPPPVGGCRGCCSNCGGGTCAPCFGPAPEFSGCNLAGIWPSLLEWDLCFACVTVAAQAPGTSIVRVDAAMSTLGGVPFDLVPSETTVRILTDCNGNGTWDDDEIASGTSLDCNANGWPDGCDIASGFSLDADMDGVPNECDAEPGCSSMCLGDVNADGMRDARDIRCFVECVSGSATAACPACGCGDMNDDGTVDDMDTPLFVDAIILDPDAMCP